MELYIEEVIIENYIFTLVLISSTEFLTKTKVKFLKKQCVCLLSVVLSVTLGFLTLSPILQTLYKFIASLIICFSCFYSCSVKKDILSYIIFMFSSILFGGLLMMLYFTIYGTNSGQPTLPIYIIILSLLIAVKLLKSAFSYINHQVKIEQFVFDIELCNNGKSIFTKAYLDSGNFLFDEKTNKPIILINFSVANNLLNIEVEDLLTNNLNNLQRCHYIDISTANKKSKLLVFEINRATIKVDGHSKVISDAELGLSLAKFNKSTGCDALISTLVLQN